MTYKGQFVFLFDGFSWKMDSANQVIFLEKSYSM